MIKGNLNFRQNIIGFWLVCDDCRTRFTKNEINLMVNLFIAYGGYFGRDVKKDQALTLEQKLERLRIENNKYKLNKNLFRRNAKSLHDALLLGIPPSHLSVR